MVDFCCTSKPSQFRVRKLRDRNFTNCPKLGTKKLIIFAKKYWCLKIKGVRILRGIMENTEVLVQADQDACKQTHTGKHTHTPK